MTITTVFESIQEMKEFAGFVSAAGEPTAGEPRNVSAGRAPVAQAPMPGPYQPAPAARQAQVTQAPAQPGATAPQPAPMNPAQVSPPVPQPVPTTAPGYTLDDLAGAAMTLMDAGRQGDLVNLLAGFGVNTLPELPQGRYGEFATALRGMGAHI